MSPAKALDLFHRATLLVRSDPLRNRQMLCFPGGREDEPNELLVLGDLHNHARNFEKFRKVAALQQFPRRHVLLQEIIHGGPLGPQGEDRSWDMLVDALEWSCQFPGRVHFILANHDVAQVQRLAIMKDGYDLTDRFDRYVDVRLGRDAPAAHQAFARFVYSLPLAAITVSGILFAHSLPSARDIAGFDRTILRRELTDQDYCATAPSISLSGAAGRTRKCSTPSPRPGGRNSLSAGISPLTRALRHRRSHADHRLLAQPRRFPAAEPLPAIHLQRPGRCRHPPGFDRLTAYGAARSAMANFQFPIAAIRNGSS